ncbi:S8 family serine peptidase [Deinococcus deserti]|uniref:Putative Peptidase S8 and S53, subtilisin, kexin, sedolisin n=1 Tax=Deinococcus deserti (strain DSM 17065 / CIP 109153 / LMG 22923 / VCD115) TaxID=546414 RepID=C1CYG5_DEIDV|nr:S8 family serine peptidase [Deinococcus deserti]ACO44986.2 putative Peptidase S8 and S53, subtilisin, kexin, sedolisin precursor [Deinococcus deserti VCD115]
MLRITKQTFLLAGLTALLAACGTTTTTADTTLSAQAAMPASTASIRMTTAEAAGSFGAWATGSFGAWASGSFGAWASGSFGVWATTFADGTPNPLHNNVEEWNQIHLAGAQTLAPNLGAGVIVAVIDTGIDLKHPAFEGTLTPARTWRDYAMSGRPDRDPSEEGTPADHGYGHGTAVAGIILQVAPNAKILPIRALRATGEGSSTDIAEAITYAVDQGAKIINVSAVADRDSDISKAIDYASVKGAYVVMAAGNRGDHVVQYPASKAGLTNSMGIMGISVGSIERTFKKSAYSNYGHQLEILAPGTEIVTAYPEGQIRAVTGTSFAVPVVSGVLALALGERYSADNAGQLAEKLKFGGRNVDEYNTDLMGTMGGQILGSGLLNAEAFLNNVR